MDGIFSIDDEDLDFSDGENLLSINMSSNIKFPVTKTVQLEGKTVRDTSFVKIISSTLPNSAIQKNYQSRDDNNNNFGKHQVFKAGVFTLPSADTDIVNDKKISNVNNLESFFNEDVDDEIFSQFPLEDASKSLNSERLERNKPTTNTDQTNVENDFNLSSSINVKTNFKSTTSNLNAKKTKLNTVPCVKDSIKRAKPISPAKLSHSLNITQNTFSSSCTSKSFVQNLALCSPCQGTSRKEKVFSQKDLFQNKAFCSSEEASLSPDLRNNFNFTESNKVSNVNKYPFSSLALIKDNVSKNNLVVTPCVSHDKTKQDLCNNRLTSNLKKAHSASFLTGIDKRRIADTFSENTYDQTISNIANDCQTPSKFSINSHQKRANDSNHQVSSNDRFEIQQTPTFSRIQTGIASSKSLRNSQVLYNPTSGAFCRKSNVSICWSESNSSISTPLQTSAMLQNSPKTVTLFSGHKEPLEACIKRSVLKRKSFEFSRKIPNEISKFPGPAGRLPKLNNINLDTLKSPEFETKKRSLTPKASPCQFEVDNNFPTSLFDECISEFKRLFPTNEPQCIASIIKCAASNKLENGKVHLMCVLIKLFSISGTNGKVVLYDSTGQINATTHKLVLDEFESDLRAGTGLILRDVSVYSPTPKKHYVNITPINIVNIFPADLNETIAQTQLTQVFEKENLLGCKKANTQIGQRLNNNSNEATNTSLLSNDSSFNNADDILDFFSGEF